MNIRVITKTEEFYECKAIWKQMDKWCCLFMLFDWLYLWWQSYEAEDIKLRLYIAENEDGDVIAILPLMLLKRDGIQTLTQLGDSGSDYFGIVCDPNNNAGIVELFNEIKEEETYDRFVLSKLRIDALTTEKLLKAGINAFNDIEIINQGKTYYVDTDRTYVEYYESQSRNFRHKINQISKYSDKYEFVAIDEYSKEIINETIRLHKDRWMKSAQLSVFFDRRRCEFYHKICERMSREKKLRLFVLKTNDSIKAYRIGFVDKGIYYDWNTAFDMNCMSESVGILLCDRVVRYCCASGIKEFDFLRGEEDYKKRFATGFRNYLAIDLKRNLDIEGYVYNPPLKKVQARLKGINCVVFAWQNFLGLDLREKDELKDLLTVLKRSNISVYLCEDDFDSLNGNCLIIGDDLEKIIKISDGNAMTCLYIDDFENQYLIRQKPDMSVSSFTDLLEYFEHNTIQERAE